VPPPVFVGCHPGNFRRGRPAGIVPDAVVIHVIVGSLKTADAWFNDARAQVSAHYGVGKDGVVHQYVEEFDTAFHAGTVERPAWRLLRAGMNPNAHTIGIEHEGFEATEWTDAMYASTAELVRTAAARWGFPVDADHVIPHRAVRATKTCPGRVADLARIVAEAGGAAAPALALPGSVTARTNANVRRGAPSVAAPVERVLAAGTAFAVASLSRTGDPVGGNPLWYGDAAGNFLWSGVTDRPRP
jgi:N-acetyl-anhydromuramyl-L-alanine amidase AmpD